MLASVDIKTRFLILASVRSYNNLLGFNAQFPLESRKDYAFTIAQHALKNVEVESRTRMLFLLSPKIFMQTIQQPSNEFRWVTLLF